MDNRIENSARKLPRYNRGRLLRACLSFSQLWFPRSILTYIAAVLLASAVVTPFSANVVLAARNINSDVLSYAYLYSLESCIDGSYDHLNDGGLWDGGVGTKISEAHVKSGDWFRSNDSYNVMDGEPHRRAATFLDPSVGKTDSDRGLSSCNSIVKSATKLWGYADSFQLMCSFVSTRANGSSCATGSGDFDQINGAHGKFRDAVIKKVFGGTAPKLDGAAWYQIYLSALMKGCSAKPSSKPAADFAYTVTVVDASGNVPSSGATYEGLKRDTRRFIITDSGMNQVEKSCSEIADGVNKYAQAYGDAVKSGATSTPLGGGTDAACDQNPTDPACTTDAKPSCNIESVGWILCPVLTAGANLADSAYGFLADNFLRIDTKLISSDSGGGSNGTYLAWGIIRSIANVAFIIVFLIIIFSQLTNLGVSNYGVKKMLPRLIVGAVLVNLSFVVCQFAIDLSNIAGYGFQSLLEGVAKQVTDAGGGTAVNAGDESGHLLGIITLIITAGTLVWINLGAVALAIIAGLIVLLTVFALLVVRQALVVLLIVLAPLAFVAFLLPNTETLFKKWRGMFVAMLVLFPIIGLLFGASKLASAILLQAAGDDLLLKIAAYIALVVPLIAVIPLLKGALNGIPAIGAAIQKFGQRGSSMAQGGAKRGAARIKNSGYGKFRAAKRSDRKARIAAGTYAGIGGKFNPRNLRSKANASMNQSRGFNVVTGGFGAQRDLAAQAQNRSDQKDAVDMFGGDDALAAAWAVSGGSTKHAAFAALQAPQQAQFKKMVEAGHARKAASFLASAQYLSENGKGSAADVAQALASARAAGANDTTVSGAEQSAIASYRKSGRGDALAQLQSAVNARAGKPPMSLQQGWGEVAPSAVHRDGIDATKNAAGRAAYETHLQADSEHTRQALAGFDSMEQRARGQAEGAILAAAQLHQYNATGVAPTISSIQDAKDYFKVR